MSMVQAYRQFSLVCPIVAILADNQIINVHQSRLWRYEMALHSKTQRCGILSSRIIVVYTINQELAMVVSVWDRRQAALKEIPNDY